MFMGFSARSLVVLAFVLAPAAASAQGAPAAGTGGAPQQAPPAQAPAGGGGPGASGGAGAAVPGPGAGATTAEPKKPAGNTGGYSFKDAPAPKRAATTRGVVRRASGPVATLPGFEQLGDGGSRLFVQLTQSVQVEERKAQGSITYVLKGAHVTRWNNTNALVTVHFNTPVSRARLVPQGNDLLFIVDLRAAATPAFKIAEAPDKTSMLTVDFPKGDYAGTETTVPTDGPPQPKKKGSKKGAGAAPPPPPPAGGDAPADTTGPTP
jgi:hypothetical protein